MALMLPDCHRGEHAAGAQIPDSPRGGDPICTGDGNTIDREPCDPRPVLLLQRDTTWLTTHAISTPRTGPRGLGYVRHNPKAVGAGCVAFDAEPV